MSLVYCEYSALILFFGYVLCTPTATNITVVRKKLKQIDATIMELLDLFPERKPIDCTEAKVNGVNVSGVYEVQPTNSITNPLSFRVYCDMETDGGGWTVIQRRGMSKKKFGYPVYYFYRNWKNYSDGFGNLYEEFWLGNNKIHSLTKQGMYSLRVDMKDMEEEHRYANYQEFRVENEAALYRLHIKGYSGNASDSFSYHHGLKFSAIDRDNDESSDECSKNLDLGGWWYKSCHECNLNGLNLKGRYTGHLSGIEWSKWKGRHYSLPFVEMKIRRN